MRSFALFLIAALVASASAQVDVCEDQPIYDGDDCTVFTDEDCTEEGKRYRVACELNEVAFPLHISRMYQESDQADLVQSGPSGQIIWLC